MRNRRRLEIEGAVQGVGFRPFVHRLAREVGLGGWVVNDTRGVVVEVEGDASTIDAFVERLRRELPPPAEIDRLRTSSLEPVDEAEFTIRTSDAGGRRTAQMLPDIATCDACRREVEDPADRRHGYPFTNCTHCGPRLTIIRSLPYDRPRTSMAGFEMCADCAREYGDPEDRRFHAQPNACPVCGPRLALLDGAGASLATGSEALRRTVDAIGRGEIVAVKGLGGFHLMVDARGGDAVQRLRRRKPRREKPLALMVRDVEQARELCDVSATEATILGSAEAPIVLLPRKPGAPIASSVAPGNPCLGLMLPCTPLHHLLLGQVGSPVVATSGNLSDEPICIDDASALDRLRSVADLFLTHDRPIVRHADDSIVRVFERGPTILRRARGFAPRPVRVEDELPPLLAVGGHLKNTVALGTGGQVFVSQHIGDMETTEALFAFERAVDDFLDLYEAAPVAVAHDLHPDYATTRWVLEGTNPALRDLPRVAVQHHHAHLASVLADNAHAGPALGVIWDGTGYGPDGSIWGGEFLLGDAAGYRRVAHLRPFRLPGGDAAIREPRRSALALLREAERHDLIDDRSLPLLREFEDGELRVLLRLLETGARAPWTSSAGRLFDGVAALAGLRSRSTYEGQAAMALEFAADPAEDGAYPFTVAEGDDGELILDWRPTLAALLDDQRREVGAGRISGRFHGMLRDAIVEVAGRIGCATVALSGGCFQNRLLLERTMSALERAGFEVVVHRRVPPNDGGISLGQIAVAAASLARTDA